MTLFLAACAIATPQATSTLLPSPMPSATGLPESTSTLTPTPYHPTTPTPPRRSTPIVTLTPVSFPSLTRMPTVSSTLYVFPVQPASKATFGEGTAGHGYPATDIFAAEGTKFVAVINGVVDFVSYEDRWNPEKPDSALRGGLAVAIIGIDGWRYYGSHLSRIAEGITVGVQVSAGQALGYVGNSGDAAGKTPHVHFGISHPTYPTDWKTRRGEIDPFPYLNAWKKGIGMEPAFP